MKDPSKLHRCLPKKRTKIIIASEATISLRVPASCAVLVRRIKVDDSEGPITERKESIISDDIRPDEDSTIDEDDLLRLLILPECPQSCRRI
jgi:hypothetical protein